MEPAVRGFLASCPRALDKGKSSTRTALRRLCGLAPQLLPEPSQINNSRFLQGHLQRRGSIEAQSSLLLFQKLFQTDANFFVIEHFTALDLRESFFDLADKPIVVPQQAFDCFANKGLRISALLFRYALQLSLKLRRKIDFHIVSLSARSDIGQEFDINGWRRGCRPWRRNRRRLPRLLAKRKSCPRSTSYLHR